MNEQQLRQQLESRLKRPDWQTNFDQEKKELRIEHKTTKKGMSLSIPKILSKWETKKEAAIEEVVYTVEETLKVMHEQHVLNGKEKQIFPVMRSTSFPTESVEGNKLYFDEHTAETRIYYALDLGKSYRLIDEKLINQEGLTKEHIKEMAMFNLRSLHTPLKKDSVAGNDFYFINTKDGYDASRILNVSFLEKFKQDISGDMAVAVPHQDVFILADLQNEKGYDILGQMCMHFFTNGRVPITVMPFLYEDNEFEPIFVFASKKSE
jgi:uncharacterized protein YtpQ (UPF0354 family)